MSKKTLVIIFVKQMIYISKIMAKYLDTIFDVILVDNATFNSDFKLFEKADFFLAYCIFMINPDLFSSLNKRLIIYQLEQHVNKQISRHYNKMIIDGTFLKVYNDASILNLEYCEQNQNLVKSKYNIDSTLLQIPIDTLSTTITPYISKPINILFIGCMNERRVRILQRLSRRFTINSVTQSAFDTDLIPYFSQCKILLNIHYYENAILERVRINEALHHGMLVVSERPNPLDSKSMDYYGNTVKFVDSEQDIEHVVTKLLKTYDMKKHLQMVDSKLNELNAEFKSNLLQIFEELN